MKKYIQEYCVGCGLCKSIDNTELRLDKKGYFYPTNGNDELLEKICPASGEQLKDMDLNKIWGREEGVFIGWSNDTVVRQQASSGGVITEITSYLLEKKIVDGIIHVTKEASNPTKTEICISCTRDELLSRCGSRYAISSPLAEMDKLDASKKYAFVGKPCDVTALTNYMRINARMREVVPYTISFFCAGLPSAAAQKNLIQRLGCEKKVVDLRYRGNGWPGYTTAIDENGESYQLDYDTSWGHILGRDIMKACRFCLDGIGEMADISCGDAWHITNENKPDFTEHDGRNVVFARTEKGKNLLMQMQQENSIHLEEFADYEEKLKIIQTYQYERKATMKAKLMGMRCFLKKTPKYPLKQMDTLDCQISKDKKKKIFVGTIKRVIKGKM